MIGLHSENHHNNITFSLTLTLFSYLAYLIWIWQLKKGGSNRGIITSQSFAHSHTKNLRDPARSYLYMLIIDDVFWILHEFYTRPCDLVLNSARFPDWTTLRYNLICIMNIDNENHTVFLKVHFEHQIMMLNSLKVERCTNEWQFTFLCDRFCHCKLQ